MKKLLVFNCHEAYVHQLSAIGYPMDVIVGLKGRYKEQWDTQIRPAPPNARFVSLEQARESRTEYYCIIAHNISDLMDVKHRPEPRLLIIHSTLEGRTAEEDTDISPEKMKKTLSTYLKLIAAHPVAVSALKARSWGFVDDVVPFAVDTDDYLPWEGDCAAGLRICNFISSRKNILLWDFHLRAFEDSPVRLIGHNPDMPGVQAADSWNDLKESLSAHRFYIHTADPKMEDGYNMATLEAMAAGLAVLSNNHPSSPIEHGRNGFLSDDPAELAGFARQLLDDHDLAAKMGQNARRTVAEQFSIEKFRKGMINSIETARQKATRRLAKDLSPRKTQKTRPIIDIHPPSETPSPESAPLHKHKTND